MLSFRYTGRSTPRPKIFLLLTSYFFLLHSPFDHLLHHKRYDIVGIGVHAETGIKAQFLGQFVGDTGALARQANVVLSTGKPDEVCALGLAPTTSTTVMNVIGDALVVETMKKIGFTVEDYNKRHHGGYLGMRSKKLL